MRLQSFFVNIHRRVLFFGFSLFSLTICERNCRIIFGKRTNKQRRSNGGVEKRRRLGPV